MIKNIVIILLTSIILLGAANYEQKPEPVSIAIYNNMIFVVYNNGAINKGSCDILCERYSFRLIKGAD